VRVPSRRTLLLCAAGLLAALAVRLAMLRSFPGNYDSDSYRIIAAAAQRGEDLYGPAGRYNYSPLWAWILRELERAGSAAGIDLTRMVGLFLTVVDLTTAGVVFFLCRSRMPADRAALAGALFFANPVSVLVTSFHGQFDNLSFLFLLLALLCFRKESSPGLLTAAALALSLAVKHVTWFFPLLFTARRRPRLPLALAAGTYVLFLASFLPSWRSWRGILDRVFGYRGELGHYGLEGLLLVFPSMPMALLTVFLFVAVGVAIVKLARVEIARACLLLVLVQMIFLPGFARQYCVWPIALGSLFPSPGYLIYTLIAAGFVLNASLGIESAPAWLPGWYGPWWAAIVWLLLEVRKLGASALPALVPSPRTASA
jgi:hypothetical protein